MRIRSRQAEPFALGPASWRRGRKLAIAVALSAAIPWAQAMAADEDDERSGRYCSSTALTLFQSCLSEVTDDFFKARAICINVSDAQQRKQCFAGTRDSRQEGSRRCGAQLAGRREACKLLGEGRYDPRIDPAAFETDFANLTNPNRYFPLGIGNRWEYAGGDELNLVTVQNKTKLIEGVNCIVVQDLVYRGGDLVEATDDWFAQARNGDVHYFGEEVKDYESFDGDHPRLPELVSRDGSFKWGRDGDKGGIFFRAWPQKGDTYLEEFSLGNAEDVTEVLSTTYAYGSSPELDQFVPAQLVKLLCPGDCIVTKNYSLLEPGVFARKFYARGIGFFLEVKPESGAAVQLVNCNFDTRCSSLPKP